MSRIGKIPVVLPKGVKVTVDPSHVFLEGPKGKLTLDIPLGITVEQKEEKLIIKRTSDTKQNRSNHGTIRALLVNMVAGVTQGHKKTLEIQGVGFRAQAQGQKLNMSLGFSHQIDLEIPAGVAVKTPKPTDVEVEGINNMLVGQVTANIRKIKPPEPYKGKGIRYSGEFVRRKQGKQVTK